MANWIENVPNPKSLVLAWQAPDSAGDRFRWAVGRLKHMASGKLQLRYFGPGQEFQEMNQGRQFEEIVSLGFRGYPSFKTQWLVHEHNVEEVLLRRLPPRQRTDFGEYLKRFAVTPGKRLSSLQLLALSEAKLPGDGFSVVNPLDPLTDRCELLLEVAGHRYYAAGATDVLSEGADIQLVTEPENPYDRNAIAIKVAGKTIGYVNRLQTHAFHKWISEGRVSGVIERLNGKPENPRAYVFYKVRPVSVRSAA